MDQIMQSVPPLTKKLISPFDKIHQHHHRHRHRHHRHSQSEGQSCHDSESSDQNSDSKANSVPRVRQLNNNNNNTGANGNITSTNTQLRTFKSPSSSLKTNTFLYIDTPHNDTTILNIVRNQHESNRRCCDCNSSKNVDWISINLLCVLCITCSGVHRSLGSHISKIRSLTLDTFRSPELLYLLENNVSNYLINSIYEATLDPKLKISPSSTDADRTRFIIEKYQRRTYVADGHKSHQESLRQLIRAIHLNSIHLLQQTIAQSEESLKSLTGGYVSPSSNTTLFKYSLRHYVVVEKRPVFYVTEFLLLNGVEVDSDLPVGPENEVRRWPVDILKYWEKKLEVYGGKGVTNDGDNNNNSNNANNNNINTNSNSNKRWNLGHSMHKSLKMTKNLIKNGR